MKRFITFSTIILSIFLLASCQSTKVVECTSSDWLSSHMEDGFVTGKTDYVISGMMVNEPYDTYNFLELTDYHVEDDGVSVVLKGTLGEEWVTKLSKVLKTYTKEDGSALTESDLLDNKGTFIPLRAKATPDANFAFFVPKNVIVEVQTAWGDVLYTNKSETDHGKGDYLVCINKDGQPDLSDVWVVNGAVFETTYNLNNK